MVITMADTINEEKTPVQKAVEAGLHFEEAPEFIPPQIPDTKTTVVSQSAPQAPAKHLLDASKEPVKKSHRKKLGTLIFIALLFGLGIWLSSQLRLFVVPQTALENADETQFLTPSVPVLISSPSASIASQFAVIRDWQTVTVSAVGLLLRKVTYQLPQSVALPVCDGQGCPSSGTYLSFGTRFTVAARGKGERLPDFRGAILTDANGKEFTMRQTSVGGKDVYEYTGDFVGRTGGGYQFIKMRGVLVPVSDTVSIEFNHFAPAGTVSDFAADDEVFDQIISSVKLPATEK